VESRGVEPRRRACKAQLQPAGVPDSDRGGDRTHTHQALNLTPLPVGVPGQCAPRVEHIQLQTRESNPASRLMRPERAPARLQGSSDGGSRTHTTRLLRPRPLPGWATSLSIDPCGIRTRVAGVRDRRPEPLDERAEFLRAATARGRVRQCVGQGSNLPGPRAAGLQPGGTPLCRPTHWLTCQTVAGLCEAGRTGVTDPGYRFDLFASSTGGSRTHTPPGLSGSARPGWRTVPRSQRP
jgi:hypothetical protein